MEGRLVSKDGCLLLAANRHGRDLQLLPVWPTGSRYNGVAVVPSLPGAAETSFVVGADVKVEGGGPDWSDLPTNFDYLLPWRDKCGARPFFVSAVSHSG